MYVSIAPTVYIAMHPRSESLTIGCPYDVFALKQMLLIRKCWEDTIN